PMSATAADNPHLPTPPGRHISLLFFFNATATTEIYTLSLHDALPIYPYGTMVTPTATTSAPLPSGTFDAKWIEVKLPAATWLKRSEEHTSELQSRGHLVCRLLLEKKKRAAHRDSEPRRDRLGGPRSRP